MSLEPPSRIAILGAGPIGLEAALYGRFLGYQVDVFERGSSIAENVRAWGHVRLFSPFGMNASPLGIAAIVAQEPAWHRPADDEFLTGQEFINRYLMFLAQTDLVVDSVHVQTRVVAVGREGHLKSRPEPPRERTRFRILTESSDGTERMWSADAVLDTTGTYGNHNWLGPGGIPAVGERAAASRITYGLPDMLGRDRGDYAGRHVLVVGAGDSAATSVVAVAQLARQVPGTRLTWLTRREAAEGEGPVRLISDDQLAARRLLAETANELAGKAADFVSHIHGATIERVDADAASARLQVTLSGVDETQLVVDRIVANVGYRPDTDLCRELHVPTDYASKAPATPSSAFDETSGDKPGRASRGPEPGTSPEPYFFVLGAKSYGRRSDFLLSAGLEQVRDAFKIIGGNSDLDLYRSIGHQRQAERRAGGEV